MDNNVNIYIVVAVFVGLLLLYPFLLRFFKTTLFTHDSSQAQAHAHAQYEQKYTVHAMNTGTGNDTNTNLIVGAPVPLPAPSTKAINNQTPDGDLVSKYYESTQVRPVPEQYCYKPIGACPDSKPMSTDMPIGNVPMCVAVLEGDKNMRLRVN
jgi:hypothetical protein